MVPGHIGYTIHRALDGTRIMHIDQMNYANLSRFINHSCFPNFQVWQMDNAERAVAYPLRDIQEGEEITIDYQLDSVHSPRGVAVCHCGARNCRKKLI
jgi:SET domain-containing protein